jgi:hypothetical protein
MIHYEVLSLWCGGDSGLVAVGMNHCLRDSRRKICTWKDKARGGKAVILCDEPSLNKVDFDCHGPHCFILWLNKINLFFDRSVL